MGVSKVLADLRPRHASSVDPPLRPVVGILAFESAASMSRLVSLHRSLANEEVRRLRADMRSAGVGYLTSKDQTFLLRLACAEVISEIDKAAATVSRLGPKCCDPLLRGFDRIYADLKAGSGSVQLFLLESRAAADLDRLGLGSTAKRVEKRVKKMEKYVAATSTLYAEMEVLSQLEASEKRIELLQQQHFRRQSGPITVPKPPGAPPPPNPIHLELRAQRHRIRRLKEESLWNKTYDKAVELMVRAVVTIFARICDVFGPCVLGLPPSRHQIHQFNLSHPSKLHTSGPLERQVVPQHVPSLRNSAPILSMVANDALELTPFERLSKLLKEAPPNTVGGSGLALRHANLILAAERLYQERRQMAPEVEEQKEDKNAAAAAAAAAAREELFQMMPSGMRAAVTAKLRECWRREGRKSSADASMAEGWKEAVAAILVWLGPVAHDTVRWQEERNMERERRFYTRPRVLLLQTLHFADVEKTEAAIVEVLVGLSCMSWYEERGWA